MQPGHVCWNVLLTWDVEAAKAFHAALSGWTYTSSGRDDGFWFASRDGERVAGLFKMTRPDFNGIPAHWFSYIATADIDAAVARLLSLGGMVIRMPFDVDRYRMAILKDSGGAAFGLCQDLGASD